ncbi:MAG: ComEC/Rec2 family competence protein [Clostridia bacterium]|nr:ComEC/Rec2 family competence protein [Clostridia bacterium]
MYISEHIITSKHYLILFISSFVLGILSAAVLGYTFTLTLIVVTLFISAIITVLTMIFKKKNSKFLIVSLIMGIFAVLGVLRLYIADTPQSYTLSDFEGKEAWLSGTVSSEPRLTSTKFSYTFDLDLMSLNHHIPAKGTIVMYVPAAYGCDVNLGDKVFCWAKIEKPTSSQISLSFDYYSQLKGRNVFVTGSTYNINHLTNYTPKTLVSVIKETGYFVRSKISYAAETLFNDDPTASAILSGILVGNKSGFDDQLYKKFSNAGISHIVAVSGLHLSILYAFLTMLLLPIMRSRKLTSAVLIPFILLFMSASAFTPSVCRASIMVLITILSHYTRREYNPESALFLSLGIILFFAPYSLFSKSLVLSFSATLGIFLYYSYIYEILKLPLALSAIPKSKIGKLSSSAFSFIFSSLALSYATFLGTSYFLGLFFGSISKVQFFTNLWVIPLASLVFCLGYMACIMFYISPSLSAKILKYPLSLCLEAIKLTAEHFGNDSYSVKFDLPSQTFTHLAAYIGLSFILYRLFKAFHDMQVQKTIKEKP